LSSSRAGPTNDVEHEADEAVVAGKDGKVGVDEDDVLEVVDDRLAVEEIVGDDKEVPGKHRRESDQPLSEGT
jgi:hypothetical protein